ncbi:MAG: hypothetical protein ACRDI2_01475 [Chloroflexota bacterium]
MLRLLLAHIDHSGKGCAVAEGMAVPAGGGGASTPSPAIPLLILGAPDSEDSDDRGDPSTSRPRAHLWLKLVLAAAIFLMGLLGGALSAAFAEGSAPASAQPAAVGITPRR